METIRPNVQGDNDRIHQKLRQYNRKFIHNFKDYSFHIEQDGVMVAGIVASSTMDTLEVEFLFVEEAYRGRGLGQQLLEHVEKLARQEGLRRILLNTYSFQAPGFYQKLGYQQIAEIAPCFGDFCQYFFVREL